MTRLDEALRHLGRGPILSRHLHARAHGPGRYGQLNAWIAVKATEGLSSMTFFDMQVQQTEILRRLDQPDRVDGCHGGDG